MKFVGGIAWNSMTKKNAGRGWVFSEDFYILNKIMIGRIPRTQYIGTCLYDTVTHTTAHMIECVMIKINYNQSKRESKKMCS